MEQQCSNDKREYLNILRRLHEQNADAMDKLKVLLFYFVDIYAFGTFSVHISLFLISRVPCNSC